MFNKESRQRRRRRKLIFARYAYVVGSMRKTMERYDINRLPLKTFGEILDQAKFTSEELYRYADNLVACNNFNKTLVLLYNYAQEHARHNIYRHTVTPAVVEEWIEALKASYLKAEQDEIRRKD